MIHTPASPKFSGFHDLIQFRVREILLVSSPYDAFVLEEDGQLSERILSEYLEQDLRYIPRIFRASSPEEAFRLLRTRTFDLVISMIRTGEMGPLAFRRGVKEIAPHLPVMFLTFEAADPELLHALRAEDDLDRIFFWSGNSRILLAIIKLVEDARNAPYDTRAGVQVVLLIEDSFRFYSLYLPLIYTEILTQTRHHLKEGMNDLHRLLRMRARPKILLAETYEEATAYFERYRQNLLGLVSDARFPREGRLDPEAGLRFAERAKREVPDLPVLLQSSEHENLKAAEDRAFAFLDKTSPDLIPGIRAFIVNNFGFGDFVFRLPSGRRMGRARNLREFVDLLERVPGKCLEYHATRNHISIWLRARTEFELANELRSQRSDDFSDMESVRRYLVDRIRETMRRKQEGVVRDFFSSWQAQAPGFSRLGKGSLGGKGRGLAFLNAVLAQHRFKEKYREVEVRIPDTYVLGTDAFETFVRDNRLQRYAAARSEDTEVVEAFLACPLPGEVLSDLDALLQKLQRPIAVRSSSLLEDNQALPFAGIYKTFMLPNNHADRRVRLNQLTDAIRLVYASIYFQSSKEYVRNTGFRNEDERMAIIIQEMAGRHHEDLFYPTLSGVARSYNYYPFPDMRPEDGVVSLALGLGKSVVEGEKVYHYCPAHPRVGPPFGSEVELAWNTQTEFYALDLSDPELYPVNDETFSLRRLPIEVAERHGTLEWVASTLTPEGSIRDALLPEGARILRFARLLRYEEQPFNALVRDLLSIGRSSFAAPVEIEFALDLPRRGEQERPLFSVLQVRPMGVIRQYREVDLEALDTTRALCTSTSAMGNGAYEDIRDIVFLDPDAFDIRHTRRIATEIGSLNEELVQERRPYLLVGFGRWGTSDPSLGVPVSWNQISGAQVYVEADREDLWVKPSQGSHFFQNMVSLRLGYLFVRMANDRELLDWDWLRAQPPHRRTRFCRHLRFEEPVLVECDGRSSSAVVYKPGEASP